MTVLHCLSRRTGSVLSSIKISSCLLQGYGLRYKSGETKLLQQIKSRIRFRGPITVADYMKDVLTNPLAGYYMHRDVFGERGDFITSPEISQMFGELLGVWCVNEWMRCGSPASLQIIELGPGRGTLSDDILRVCTQFEGMREAVSLHMVEVSPKMMEIQKRVLTSQALNADEQITSSATAQRSSIQQSTETFSHSIDASGVADRQIVSTDVRADHTPCVIESCLSRHGANVHWYRQLSDVPRGFSCIIAHEFFDALPIHKFQRKGDRWHEVLIDIDDDPDSEHHLRFVLSSTDTAALRLLLKTVQNTESRDHIELCPHGAVIIQEIAERISTDGGVSLIADYGHSGEKGDTFRGFRDHKLYPVFAEPGSADLTADVDFNHYKHCIPSNVRTHGPISQSMFLHNMGIQVRLQMLLKKASMLQQKSLISGYKMLTDQDQMGERFKFLAMLDPNTDSSYIPAGFTSL